MVNEFLHYIVWILKAIFFKYQVISSDLKYQVKRGKGKSENFHSSKFEKRFTKT